MSDSVKSWCDACQVAFERTGYGCDGHPMCTKPEAPKGHRLTGDKELTDTGWREDVEAVESDGGVGDDFALCVSYSGTN